MKNPVMTVIAASLAFAAPAFADDTHHPDKAPETKAAPARPAAKSAPAVQKMQDNVRKMRLQLDHIAGAKTDEERQKALSDHLRTMHENMQLARDMQAEMTGCPMMEGGMMRGGGMMGGMMGKGMMGEGMPAGASPDRMQQMEKRMDMMQMMMEQMMHRQPGAEPMPMPK